MMLRIRNYMILRDIRNGVNKLSDESVLLLSSDLYSAYGDSINIYVGVTSPFKAKFVKRIPEIEYDMDLYNAFIFISTEYAKSHNIAEKTLNVIKERNIKYFEKIKHV